MYVNVTLYTNLILTIQTLLGTNHIFLIYNRPTHFDLERSQVPYDSNVLKLRQNLSSKNIDVKIFDFLKLKHDLETNIQRYLDILLIVMDVDLNFLEFITKIFDDLPQTLYTKWFFLSHNFQPEQLYEIFKPIYIKISTLVLFPISSTDNELEIWEVYKLSKTGPPYISKLYNWNETKEVDGIESLQSRRSNLNGVKIRVASFISEPYVFMDARYNLAGFFGSMWKELETDFNFTSEFIFNQQTTGEKIIGIKDMVEAIKAGQAEVGLQAATISGETLADYDFSQPILTIKNVFLFRPPNDVQWNIYFLPFRPGVWISIIILIILAPYVLNILYHLNCHFRYLCVRNIFSDTVLDIYAAYCQQGSSKAPTALSFRIVYLTVYISSVVLLSAYSASLISNITVQKVSLPFNNLVDLYENGKYTLGVAPQSFQYQYFNESNNELHRKIASKLMEPEDKLPKTYQEAIDRICSEDRYIYFVDQLVYEFYKLYMPCQIQVHSTSISSSVSIIFGKNFPFKQLLSSRIEKMKQTGILQRIMYKELAINFKVLEVAPFRTVDLFTVTPLLSLFIIGIVFSISALVYEQYKWEVKQNKKKTICERVHAKYRKWFMDPISSFFYSLIPQKVKEVLEI